MTSATRIGAHIATVLLATVVALTTVACGRSGTAATDAGGDAGLDVAAEVGMTSCDPAAQDCAGGEKCDFRCAGTQAIVDCHASTAGGTVGSACSTTSMPCARGTGCIALPATGGATCRKYCAVDGDCATGERCHNVAVGINCGDGTTSFMLHICY